MSGIVFDSFDFGLDLRRGPSTSPSNRLRDLTNCYITTGKEIRKRPGLELVATLEAGTKGLKGGLGKLNTFYESGTVTHANTLFKSNAVMHPTPGSSSVSKIWYCDAFNGYLYVSVEYVDGQVRHHYIRSSPSGDAIPFSAKTNVATGKVMAPLTANGFVYEMTIGGFTPASDPSWPTTDGATLLVPKTAYIDYGGGNSFGTMYNLGDGLHRNASTNDPYIHEVTRAGPLGLTFTPSETIGVSYVPTGGFNAWAASFSYNLGQFVAPTAWNGYVYKVIVAGTSGASQPTWPTTVGQTVGNGGVTFECWLPGQTTCRRRPFVTARYDTRITDSNCPHGRGVTKSASKIWSTKNASPFDTVRYSKTDDCTNWTAAGDAGFLPVGLKQENAQDCKALGQFQDKLVCFFQDSAQLWTVDTNPANNALKQRIFGVGTRYPQSPASFADDVFFMADQGVRSITVNAMTANLQDSDIGSPIDSVVKPAIGLTNPYGIYIPPFGQFWLIMGTVAWVYTFSRNAKLAAWSKYTFPFNIDDIAVLDNVVYVRNNDKVYKFNESKYTDDGSTIKCRVQFPYLDFKKPGVLKQITSMDAVLEGSWGVQFLVDGNDQGNFSDPFVLTGDTRPGPSIPVELCVPAVAPVFQHAANEAAKLTALSFTYYELGAL